MDNNSLLVAAISGIVSALGILGLVIRSLTENKKPANGNGSKQSRECFEQHQEVLNKLDALSKDVGMVQKILDDRAPVFRAVEDKLNSLTLMANRWDGSDRRKS